MQTVRSEPRLTARSGSIAVLAVLLVLMVVLLPSFNGDFHDFYMAGQLLLRGDSPYLWPRYYSPIWVAASVAPLTVLPERFAYTVFTLVSLLIIALSVWRLTQGKHRLLALVTLCLLWLVQILWGNIDWVVLAALVVPAPLGVWLVLSKPQLGWILAAIMLLAMPRRRAVGTVVALAAGLGISYLIGMRAPDLATMQMWNSAPWPWGLIAGIPLVIMALMKRDRELALGASLLVSPYWQFPSFVAAWPVAARARWLWLVWLAAMLLQFADQIAALLHFRG